MRTTWRFPGRVSPETLDTDGQGNRCRQSCAAVMDCMAAHPCRSDDTISLIVILGAFKVLQWEGTIGVSSLELARAIAKGKALGALLAISSCPASFAEARHAPMSNLRATYAKLVESCKTPAAPLVPPPAMLLPGHVALSVYMLQHTTWAHSEKRIYGFGRRSVPPMGSGRGP